MALARLRGFVRRSEIPTAIHTVINTDIYTVIPWQGNGIVEGSRNSSQA